MNVPVAATALGLMILSTADPALAGEPSRQQVADRGDQVTGRATEPGFQGEGSQDFDAWLLSEARAVAERLDQEGTGRAAQGAGPMAYQALEPETPSDRGFPMRSYAGVGMGKVLLGMDIDKQEVRWAKDTRSDPTRVVLGLGYDLTQSLSLGLEYKMLADDKPLFSVDLGGQQLPMNTRFSDHKLDLTLRYRFSL